MKPHALGTPAASAAATMASALSRWQGSTDPTVRKAVATLRRMESHAAMREAYLTLQRMEQASHKSWVCGRWWLLGRYYEGLISAEEVRESLGDATLDGLDGWDGCLG